MNKQEQDVINQAVRWWADHRPSDWTEDKHVRNPSYALVRDADYKLANAVAAYVNVVGGTKTKYEKSVEEFERSRNR